MPAQIDIKEVHWLLDIVQCIDVGVVVLDRQYRVEVWNAFMENHSGLGPDQPVASNATVEGRAQNRRVEVTLRPLPGVQ